MSNPSINPAHAIHIPPSNPVLFPLAMGGTNPDGRNISANNHYLTLDGQPWLPVMGEFHFSRYPEQYWEEELLKMKAGGITIAASYIFWIHIEEVEGQFTWTGSRDLRRFVTLCGSHGLYAYPRIGPWAHGECRNGGFPDWLLEKCGAEVRRDAPLYLNFVDRLYREISHQLSGLLWKDGGPVIGIQLENELIHNAGHIRSLKRLALEAGLNVPLYTMTGWGPAEVPPGEVIPVFGGYPDAFWDRQVEDWARASRKHYFFSTIRDDNTIGADLTKREGTGDLSYLDAYPFGTCETGGGMQVSYHRRPVIEPDDVSALALVKIGNGSNLQGYYMYHGGANPGGLASTLQESQDTGYPNDLPVIDYDFQAPLGKYGQVRESYHALRLLHLFLADFGTRLAPLPAVLPTIRPSSLDDRQTLRWAVRSDGRQGFLFLNNYQRIETLPDHSAVQFEVNLPAGPLILPSHPAHIPGGIYAIWPINMVLDGVLLHYATAQPVCRIEADGEVWYIFSAQPGIPAEFAFAASSVQERSFSCEEGTFIISKPDGSRLEIRGQAPGTACHCMISNLSGQKIHLLLLSHTEARQLWKANSWGQERIFLSSDSLRFEDTRLSLQSVDSGPVSFAVFPPPKFSLESGGNLLTPQTDGIFTRFFLSPPEYNPQVSARKVKDASPAKPVHLGPAGVAKAPADSDFELAEVWDVIIPPEAFQMAHEVILQIDYVGDAARAYLGEHLIDDDFYNGRVWEIGLTRFIPDVQKNHLRLMLLPLHREAPVYLASNAQPDFQDQNQALELRQMQLRLQYEWQIGQISRPE